MRPENIYVSETKYLKYRQNIEGNNRFSNQIVKMRKFFSKLARSALSHIHRFSSMLVFCRYTVVYSAIPQVIKGNCIDYVYRCILRPENIYLSEALARACELHVQYFVVGTFGVFPPPPPIPKAGYATGVYGRHTR